MHLDERLSGDFFDAMDSLLAYVNRRFSVIPHFNMEINTSLDEAKAALIAQTLWNNRAVIADFCNENPDRLSSRIIQQVRLWEHALTGAFTVVRYQDGVALAMNDAGVFALTGVTIDIDQVIGPAPAHIEATILPFAGSIIYDGFLQAFDPESQDEIRAIQDEFEERVAQEGVIATAERFVLVAKAYNEKQLSDEMDAMLEDILRESEPKSAAEVMPAGFHRGALSLPGARERYETSQTVTDLKSFSKGEQMRIANSYRMAFAIKVNDFPEDALKACVCTLTRGDAAQIARSLGASGVKGNARKELIADQATEHILQSPWGLEASLRMCSPAAFETAMRLFKEGDFEFFADEVLDNLHVQPIVPYTFVFFRKGVYRAVMPIEVRRMMSLVDLTFVSHMRTQTSRIAQVSAAATFYYGVVSLAEVYRQYSNLYASHVDEDTFRKLFERELRHGEFGFAVWTYKEMDYLVHYTLTEDYVTHQTARAHFEQMMAAAGEYSVAEGENDDFDSALKSASSRLEVELANLQTVRESIIAQHAEVSVRPLTLEDVEVDPIEHLWQQPSVQTLLAFLDAHVPDGQNDYDFADSVVEEVLYGAVEIGDMHAILRYLESMGLSRCSSQKDTLPHLLANVFNIVPSWDNYGWSAKELMEQITGRKIFLTSEGDMMKIGPDDLCPCGSGKKYRNCHGR